MVLKNFAGKKNKQAEYVEMLHEGMVPLGERK